MPTLTENQKEDIVTLLACFKRPADVVVHMRQQWGIEVNRFQVRAYDPTNPRYEAGARWREVFMIRRQKYIEDVNGVPIAHRGYRLNRLQELLETALSAGEIALGAKLLEQAAREVGSVLTNKRELHMSQPTLKPCNTTPEERKALLTEVIRNAMASRQVGGAGD